MCGKECVSSRGLKRHRTLKQVQEEVTPKEQKKVLIAIDEFMNTVKNCADSCSEDLCLPEDPRKMFSSFDFTPVDDPVELPAVLKPVVENFHGNTENYYSNFYGLLQEKTFGGDITLTNILSPEVSYEVFENLETL